MIVKRIDGSLFRQMMNGALHRILAEERELNALNVFPVADGDTGTNMRLTVQHAMEMAPANTKLCLYLKELSKGMLLSARGNSGVILSQLFKGLYLELARCTAANTEDLRNALVRAYQVAYVAVVNPVEGTMLTVSREGIEGIKGYITRNMPPDRLLMMYLAEMTRVLERTPDLLPVLKESGVVDSGGKGWIALISGMLEALTGETPPDFALPQQESAPAPDFSLFTEDSSFRDGYCTEFILQRLHNGAYRQDFEIGAFTRGLEELGTSLAVVEQESRVKVHIHTLNPAPVIELARHYGEFLTFKLENMQIQHNQRDMETAVRETEAKAEPAGKTMPHMPLAIVAVAGGDGLADIYRQQGAARVIDGGPTMSVSAREFLEVIGQLDADHVVLLPNSANVILAAEQARGLWKGKEKTVHVISTRSAAEGYFALCMDNVNDPDPVHRIAQIEGGARDVVTLAVARAARGFTHGGRSWIRGERVAFVNGEPTVAGEELEPLLREALRAVPDLQEKETCVAFRGVPAEEAETDTVESIVSEELPMADFAAMDGGMAAVEWVMGLI